MSVEIVEPGPAVELAPAAAAHLREQARLGAASAVRISLKESGCTGYMYVMDLVNAPPESGDLVLPAGEGVNVIIAHAALPMMQGTVIDYVKEGLNSVLRFNNPNAEDYCGCGESFSIAGGVAR